MSGRIADGILVRASSLMPDTGGEADAFALQQKFLQDLDAAMHKGHPGLLLPA